jgi:hypothetical protein
MKDTNYILYVVVADRDDENYTYPSFHSPDDFDQALRVYNDMCSGSNFSYVYLEGIEATGYTATLFGHANKKE